MPGFSKMIFVTHPVWPSMLPVKASAATKPTEAIRLATSRELTVTQKFSVNADRIRPSANSSFLESQTLKAVERAQKGAAIALVRTPTIPEFVLSKMTRHDWETASANLGFGELAKLKPAKLSALKRELKARISRIYGISPRSEAAAKSIERKFLATLRRKFRERLIIPTGKKYGIGPLEIANEVGNMMAAKGMYLSGRAVVVGFGAFGEQCAAQYPTSFSRLEEGYRLVLPRKGVMWSSALRPALGRRKFRL